MAPVPAVGGGLLGLLPQDAKGNCVCTPKPDAGTLDNTVIATTTALAYPRILGSNTADVCIVRLLISSRLPPDVNGDLVVNGTDLNLISGSPYFNNDPSGPSLCPAVLSRNVCGPVDVNGDGSVNHLDVTSVTQSLFLVANVTCGGVYATAFSCGSTRQAPMTPALDISLDSIVWFSDDGLIGTTNPLINNPATRSIHLRSESNSLIHSIMDQFEVMESKIVQMEAKDAQLEAETRDLRAKNVEWEVKGAKLEAKDAEHDKALGFGKTGRREVLLDVLISLGIILATAVVMLVWRRFRPI